MPSGRMMKYFAASSSCPGPNSSPPKLRDRNAPPVPPVPCRIITALRTTPDASRRAVPSVR
jgi:hypothetical protein